MTHGIGTTSKTRRSIMGSNTEVLQHGVRIRVVRQVWPTQLVRHIDLIQPRPESFRQSESRLNSSRIPFGHLGFSSCLYDAEAPEAKKP
jgi:hypothetical protein